MDSSLSRTDEKTEAHERAERQSQQNDEPLETPSGIRLYLIFVALIFAAFLVSLNASIVSTVWHQDESTLLEPDSL